MKSTRKLFNSLLFTSALLGASVILQRPAQASTVVSPVCPDPDDVTSLAGNESTSWYNLTEDSRGEKGFCRGTPDTYGVTVYKMGFCLKDPGDPDGASGSILAGELPDYDGSGCTWTYDNETGESAVFSSGGVVELNSAFASSPAVGNYPHAVMIISKDFKIKGSYGPIPISGTDTTFYSTTTFQQSDTNSSNYGVTTAPLTTFWSGCTASTEENTVVGGTIDAYLLDSAGKIIVNNSSLEECSGQEKLLGVMNMDSAVNITPATNGLKMTFKVENNGMSVTCNESGPCTSLVFDSGPFSVVFETF